MFNIKRDSKLMQQKLEKNYLIIPSTLKRASNKFKVHIPINNNLEIDLNTMGDTKKLSFWEVYLLILSYEDKFDTLDTYTEYKDFMQEVLIYNFNNLEKRNGKFYFTAPNEHRMKTEKLTCLKDITLYKDFKKLNNFINSFDYFGLNLNMRLGPLGLSINNKEGFTSLPFTNKEYRVIRPNRVIQIQKGIEKPPIDLNLERELRNLPKDKLYSGELLEEIWAKLPKEIKDIDKILTFMKQNYTTEQINWVLENSFITCNTLSNIPSKIIIEDEKILIELPKSIF